jgi:hypothetical protein
MSSFSSLPPEMVLKIASYLEAADLANLSGVNKRFSAITGVLWNRFFREFELKSVPFIEQILIRGKLNLIN